MIARKIVDPLRSWYALYTASNHEKSVQQNLLLKGVETFLPLYSVTRRWKNRTTVKLQLPLFTGYVFAKIALSECTKVLTTPRIYSIVGNPGGPLPLPDSEIETLRSGLNTKNATPWQYVTIGTRARIKNGPLAGLEGIIVRSDAQLRLVLSLDLISKSIAVHVNAEDISVCNPVGEQR